LFDSELAGRAAVLLLAVYPNSIGYVPIALTEVLYTTLLLGLCWIVIAGRGAGHLIAAGLVAGIASLVKAQSLLVVMLVFLVAWLSGPLTAGRFARSVLQAALVIVVASLVIAPWSLRNQRIFGETVLISTNGGLTLLTGNNPSARGGYTPDDPLVTSIPRTVATEVHVDREARARAMRWIEDHPARFIMLMPLKLFRLWGPDGESEWAYQDGFARYDEFHLGFRSVRIANQIYYFSLLAAFVYGSLRLASGRAGVSTARLGWWLVPYAMALYPTLIAAVFSGQSRYHYPTMPFVVMVCGWLIARADGRGNAVSSRTASIASGAAPQNVQSIAF
jgi:hypothetical protein